MLPLLALTVALGARPMADAERDRDLAARFDVGLSVPAAEYPGPFAAPPLAKWRVRLPGATPSSAAHTERTRVVVVGRHLLVGSATGDALYLMDRRDGSLLRSFPAAGPVESEAIVDGERLFFTDTTGATWCYRLDGTLEWTHTDAAPILVRPTLHGDILVVTNVDDLVVALDANTGELLWRYRRPPDLTRDAELTLYASPPAVVDGDDVVVGFSDGAVVVFDLDSGEVRWERPVGEGRYPDLVAAPTVLGNDVFASGYFAPLVAIDRETRNIRWRLEYGAANAALLAPLDGEPTLFHPGTDGTLRAVVARTGEELWAWDSETPGALTTPVHTDAGLLVASSDGQIYLIDPHTGQRVWRYKERVLLQGVTNSPTVSGRQVFFVTNAGYLHSMVAPRRGPAYRGITPYPSSRPGERAD